MECHGILKKIITEKHKHIYKLIKEVEQHQNHPLNAIMQGSSKKKSTPFANALKKKGLQLIAEIKRCSPSVGMIKEIPLPSELAIQYCLAQAAAISVLTDEYAFKGSLNDLLQVSEAIKKHRLSTAILRKDFVVHPLQLAEAKLYGSQAVLLIAALLGKEIKQFIETAKKIGIETLVEVHTEKELYLALEAGAEIIGINHRNLNTFEVDLDLSEKLIQHIPKHVISVAESGIHNPDHARLMQNRGFNAILVGEALSRTQYPTDLIKKMRGCDDH